MLVRALTIGALLSSLLSTPLFAGSIKPDEDILFFPTAAHLTDDGGAWSVPVHAWVFEPEEDSLFRRGAVKSLALALGLEGAAAESGIFKERARWFLVDNERGKSFPVTLGGGDQPISPSQSDGHLTDRLVLPRIAAGEETTSFRLDYAAVLPPGDPRLFKGLAFFPASQGLSVISDIDDTIKISEVTDKKALLANTFLKPFAAAPGMAEAYQRLTEAGAVFHYVSSSPWQLYPPLQAFMTASEFPAGSFHLRKFRWKDESLLNLLKSSLETKPPVIDSLLKNHPGRDFILIGDSGEVDPEIYGDIARSYPGRIRHIYIRRVTAEPRDDPRYRSAFADLPDDLWTLFDDPADIRP